MTLRFRQNALLGHSVTEVRAVGSAKAALLCKMGIETVRDLLTCYPNRYIDLSRVEKISAAPIGQDVTVIGTVDSVTEKTSRPRLHILEVALFDETGIMMGVWFRQPWMAKRFTKGMRVAFRGKVGFDYGFKRMNTPFVEFLDAEQDTVPSSLIAVHPTTEGVSTSWMRRFVANALEQTSDITDPLPAALRLQRGLISRKAAFRQIHFPADKAQLAEAHGRLAYEEVLYLQFEMMMRRNDETRDGEPVVHAPGAYVAILREQLPFTLTSEQEQAIADITDDMCSERCMNRMLLGDVGTGKTVVAAFALALSADTGCQAAMMAPTEVLARQYGDKLGPLLDACGIHWGILTGSTSTAVRNKLLEQAAQGSLQVLFGTHALIEPDVQFKRLSLVVIDEQHRFGVNQRSALRLKGPGSDLLVMTATPIPRTLALTLYGDLETSYIRKRPANRAPTVTQLISRDARYVAYEAIREAAKEGRQAYIICPLVGLTREQRARSAESGKMRQALDAGDDLTDAKAAEKEAARLQREVFANLKVGLLTGHMRPAEKQQVMQDFRAGKIDVLVATTVIEVGIDVPNANVMMIEDAERFGLSQLHQLRGRVGRGQYPGQAFLVADPGKEDTDVKQRMEALVSTDDGFELAEFDLRARHEGDVLGSRQHGAATLRLVNVIDDAELVSQAHEDARAILQEDPHLQAPQHVALAREVATAFAGYDDRDLKGA